MTVGVADGFARSVKIVKTLEAASTGSAGSRRERTEDAFDLLQSLTRFEMASLSYWDDGSGAHRPVVNSGYPDHIATLCDSMMHTDKTFQELRRRRTPLRLRGLPGTSLEGTVGTRIIRRHRFRDGLTHCFFARDGRYLGYMNLTSMTRDLDDASTHVVQLIEAAVSPLLVSTARDDARSGEHHANELTAREREVLSLLPSGATNAEIGEALSISPTTVARHIEHIIAKLGAQNRTRAACIAVERGIDRSA